MIIRWLGQACFSIRTVAGTVVRMDPFDGTIGLPVSDEPADVVTMSHAHRDHGAVELVPGNPEVIDRPGTREAAGVAFTGVGSFHDDVGGAKRGRNVIVRFEADGVAVCHLGDLGHVLTGEQVKAIGRVDVLLVPVGGTYTIDARGAGEVVAQLSPRVIVPMHYRIPGLDLPIADEQPFIAGKKNVRHADQLDLSGATLPKGPEVVVLRGPV